MPCDIRVSKGAGTSMQAIFYASIEDGIVILFLRFFCKPLQVRNDEGGLLKLMMPGICDEQPVFSEK